MEWYNILSIVLTFLGSGSAVVTWLLYRKQSVRIKNAEAFEREVEALRHEIEELRASVEFERSQREKDKELLAKADALNRQLRSEFNNVEIKNAKNKSALNKAYECTFCPDSSLCPALKQRKKNEDEYLVELQRRQMK